MEPVFNKRPRKGRMLANHRTLVLNANGLPMGYPFRTLNGYQALIALSLGRVEVFAFSDTTVRSASCGYYLPSVVRMVEHVPEMPLDMVPPLTLRNLYLRDGGLCQYTGIELVLGAQDSAVQATTEHVIPRAKGGLNIWENVVLASKATNNRRGCKPLEEMGLYLQIEPWAPTYADLLLLSLLSRDALRMVPDAWRPYIAPEEIRARVMETYPVHPFVLAAAA